MTSTVTLQDRASLKAQSRYRTNEGFLRAPASLTRSGIIEYKASELNITDGDPDRVVKLFRKPEHVFNDTTKASIRGIALTVAHPKGVTPENWEKTNVGNVVGDPYRVGDMMMGEVLIGSKRGIDMVEKEGWEELSIGYSFDFKKTSADTGGYEYETTGPLVVNHVAIVEQGRAGSKIRIHDDKRGIDNMSETDISALLDQALEKREQANQQKAKAADDTKKLVAETVVDTLKVALPKMLEDMGMMKKKKKDMGGKEIDEEDEGDGGNAGKPKRGPKLPWDKGDANFIGDRIKMIAGEDADNETLGVAKKIAATFLKDEMARVATMKSVAGLLSDEQKTKLATASTKDILVAALDGKVQDAENKSVDYLQGIVDSMGIQTRNTSYEDNLLNFPDTGVSRNPGFRVVGQDMYGDISSEYQEYVQNLGDEWMNPEDRQANSGGK